MAVLLDSFFEDVLVVGQGAAPNFWTGQFASPERGAAGFLEGIVAALDAAREDRVLVLSAGAEGVAADLLLALTAWPEHDVVAPREAGRIWDFCLLVRRREVLDKAKQLLEEGENGSNVLIASLDCGFIEGADLAALVSVEN